jgi:glycosyltransferase involved in cell wall biosynthesis
VFVVDDGSDDPTTVQLLGRLQDLGYPGLADLRVIRQANQGPSAARNKAITACRSPWILPLDADDLLRPTAIKDLWGAALEDASRGIIYGQVCFFGGRSAVAGFPAFSESVMALGNVIPVTALFRREAWAAVGGFRLAMARGWEDWDFWLSLLERGEQVHQLEAVVLDVRIKRQSRNRGWSPMERRQAVETLVQHHPAFFGRHVAVLLDRVSDLEHQRQTSRYEAIKRRLREFLPGV